MSLTSSSSRTNGHGGASSSRSSQQRLRCAIYTRKSTEEGLDQEFNSLDAQREACAAFIASQVGLGWKLIADRYDDGGISGGTMERPALQRLLQDIRDKRVDVVVVYKIDRLTRSLTDFAKIVEVFDGNGVSFVSVTQQFNTTTSMGRLTVNVLLSFAQFEREVTAERIRDKIAASRQKGMWMGGRVPLGYAVVDRKLVVDREAADLVQHLFRRFLALGSVGALLEDLRRQHPSGVIRAGDAGDGKAALGLSLRHGAISYLLSNPIYIGLVRHHGDLHEGEHEAIVDAELFDQVQQQLRVRAPNRVPSSHSMVNVLSGMLYDDSGNRLTTSSSGKSGKRYRYYVSDSRANRSGQSSEGWRLPAAQIEGLVLREFAGLLSDRATVSEWLSVHSSPAHLVAGLEQAERIAVSLPSQASLEQQHLLKSAMDRVVISRGTIVLHVDTLAMARLCAGEAPVTLVDDSSRHDLDDQSNAAHVTVYERPMLMKRRGKESRIVIEGSGLREPDDALVGLVAKSQVMLASLTNGSCGSIKSLAERLGMHPADISRILPLAYLAPTIVAQILDGSQSDKLVPAQLTRSLDLPILWDEQLVELA